MHDLAADDLEPVNKADTIESGTIGLLTEKRAPAIHQRFRSGVLHHVEALVFFSDKEVI